MATNRQKAAARKNVKKAQKASASRRNAGKTPKLGSHPMTSHTEHGLSATKFAFPKERKEPLTDASHVRNAIARFNQVDLREQLIEIGSDDGIAHRIDEIVWPIRERLGCQVGRIVFSGGDGLLGVIDDGGLDGRLASLEHLMIMAKARAQIRLQS